MGLTHHDGVSVYGSGWFVGRKGSETAMAAAAGTDYGLFRMDANTASGSGHFTTISTRLSAVAFGIAQEYGTQPISASGTTIRTQWSGGAIDVYRYSVTGSAACSSQVYYMVWGR